MTTHITEESALALVALSPDDPERTEAFAHAEECPACRALLEEGKAMLSMLDAQEELPAVSPALKARVEQAVLGQRKVSAFPWRAWALVVGACLSLLMVWLDAQAGALQASLGVHCLLYELGCALVPLALTGTAMLRGVLRVEPQGLALSAMAGALVGQALLLTHCPSQGAVAHTVVFHFAGVILAALLGYTGGRLVPVRA